MTTDKPYWEQDIAECLRVAAEIIGPNSYYLRAAEYIEEMRAVNAKLTATLETIAAFAVGNGDVCEIIAKRAREALRDLPESMVRMSFDEQNSSASEAERDGGQNPVVTPTKPPEGVPKYKFHETFCSQCGGEFGPGNEGFSHCKNHKHLPRLG